MPLRSSTYEAVVASYHVEDSEDEIDYDDAGLMSRRSPWSHPLIGESHQSFAMNAINSSEDEDEGINYNFSDFDTILRYLLFQKKMVEEVFIDCTRLLKVYK